MKNVSLFLVLLVAGFASQAQSLKLTNDISNAALHIVGRSRAAAIYVDSLDHTVVRKAAVHLQNDIEAVTGIKPVITHTLKGFRDLIIIGSVDRSGGIATLIESKKFSSRINGKWEACQYQTVARPLPGIDNALVICGSDRRGTAFGVFRLSAAIGVSPWYWWADVAVKKRDALYLSAANFVDSPSVKYRGIFINDEAPALSQWSKEKFGGFNHLFYEKVFELMLRLRSNYIWPAMWGNAFYDDDSLNIRSADDYAIVIGTSHHEPLMRAHDEWRRYGDGKWNYDSNANRLNKFWEKGISRTWNEKIVSVGMRGDGDEPMSRETATELLERIVKEQRMIIASTTGKPAEQTPQLWALYKEVQDYYDQGMRVPDDVTLLLCDDNWGNIRRLPAPTAPRRSGGYGIYYHFDYVGGPRNYKWINTNPLPRIWEQMHLAWEHKVDEIWIVNVGDIKPMELPISFFLDYAWRPEAIQHHQVQRYTADWAAQQFGKGHAATIATLLAKYAKYNSRKKPELLDASTYSADYGENKMVIAEWRSLVEKAEWVRSRLLAADTNAYFQLVLHPVLASANLHEMYYKQWKNRRLEKSGSREANRYADSVAYHYQLDSLITSRYHTVNNGKWRHMMSQTHIGYTGWQQPATNVMPMVVRVTTNDSTRDALPVLTARTAAHMVPQGSRNVAIEQNGYVSIDPARFGSRRLEKDRQLVVLPDHGRVGDAVTIFPVTAAPLADTRSQPDAAYTFYNYTDTTPTIYASFSPTLNYYNNKGMRVAFSIDDQIPVIQYVNAATNDLRTWERWVSDNIIISASTHARFGKGRHTLKCWLLDPGLIIQKIVIDLGGLKQTHLGPPFTYSKN